MKEIVVISGKGGTGKTSVTASFGFLGKNMLVLADCDVDAADMHLLLNPDFQNKTDFYSGEVALIHQEKCNCCGICFDACRFKAILPENDKFVVNPMKCEGCGLCARLCPEGAITNERLKAGEYFTSVLRTGGSMVHARLSIGASNSGKLVAKVKEKAREQAQKEGKTTILVDGSPGIGCPVVSSLSGATHVVLVTEPSLSALSDLKRIIAVVKNFKIPASCIINKSDLNNDVRDEIINCLKENNIKLLEEIPYSECFTEAMVAGMTVVEYNNGLPGQNLNSSWNKIMKLI